MKTRGPHLPKCMSCHKAIAVISRRAHCICIYIYIYIYIICSSNFEVFLIHEMNIVRLSFSIEKQQNINDCLKMTLQSTRYDLESFLDAYVIPTKMKSFQGKYHFFLGWFFKAMLIFLYIININVY